MLIVGIATRLAALAQLPALVGAVALVHWKEGLFAPGQSLELAALVTFLLAVIAVFGGGRLSVDHWLEVSHRRHLDDMDGGSRAIRPSAA